MLPAAEALALLMAEVQQQRHPAVLVLTGASIWLVLLVSELHIVSQWTVAMLSYALAFAGPLVYARHADALGELCDSGAAACKWFAATQRRSRALCVGAFGLSIVCGMHGALVPRLTIAAAAVTAAVAWQLTSAI